MLPKNETLIIFGVLLVFIIYVLYNKQNEEGFETVCKNGQCLECPSKIYRNGYCYVGDVQRKCQDGYVLDNNTLLCNKNVTNENKSYVFNARPQMICKQDEIQVGNSCVLQPKYYFDPKYN
tara:strand:- start:2631 stop:2993 length:363 start_codon:yes stop_codon:yes gene_type:complete